MKVYRLEHPEDGCGPYHSNVIFDNPELLQLYQDMEQLHSVDHVESHPTFIGDFVNSGPRLASYSAEGYMFGCVSEQAVKDWFGFYLEDLYDFGFVLVEIEVKFALIGGSQTQVAFFGDSIKSKKVLYVREIR